MYVAYLKPGSAMVRLLVEEHSDLEKQDIIPDVHLNQGRHKMEKEVIQPRVLAASLSPA